MDLDFHWNYFPTQLTSQLILNFLHNVPDNLALNNRGLSAGPPSLPSNVTQSPHVMAERRPHPFEYRGRDVWILGKVRVPNGSRVLLGESPEMDPFVRSFSALDHSRRLHSSLRKFRSYASSPMESKWFVEPPLRVTETIAESLVPRHYGEDTSIQEMEPYKLNCSRCLGESRTQSIQCASFPVPLQSRLHLLPQYTVWFYPGGLIIPHSHGLTSAHKVSQGRMPLKFITFGKVSGDRFPRRYTHPYRTQFKPVSL